MCGPRAVELIIPFAGYLASEGQLKLVRESVIGALGNLAGCLLAYWLGAIGGRPLVEKFGKYVLLSHHDLDLADRWFTKYGRSTVFFTRLMPVIRTFISFPAGISRMNLTTFSIYTFLGALPWSLFLAYVGFKLGENWDTLGEYFRKADILIGILLVAAVVWYVWRHVNNMKKDRVMADKTASGDKTVSRLKVPETTEKDNTV